MKSVYMWERKKKEFAVRCTTYIGRTVCLAIVTSLPKHTFPMQRRWHWAMNNAPGSSIALVTISRGGKQSVFRPTANASVCSSNPTIVASNIFPASVKSACSGFEQPSSRGGPYP